MWKILTPFVKEEDCVANLEHLFKSAFSGGSSVTRETSCERMSSRMTLHAMPNLCVSVALIDTILLLSCFGSGFQTGNRPYSRSPRASLTGYRV